MNKSNIFRWKLREKRKMGGRDKAALFFGNRDRAALVKAKRRRVLWTCVGCENRK